MSLIPVKGAKIRSTYIAFAEKEKKRLQASIATLKAEVETKKREEGHAKSMGIRSEQTMDH
jgi:protein kinase C substrate 80K-H